ncbi:hypothetical protein HDU67_009397 [Dinochytrium kinnereticum]|nr:hypothetical protein HDU67_009397 [Dinochytrium kinnereticum]
MSPPLPMSADRDTISHPKSHEYSFVVMCWMIGACFGIVVTTFAAMLHRKGWEAIDPRKPSLFALQSMVAINLKVHQLSGNGDCGLLEALSVLTYLGSHVAQYCFYIFRYVEVYGKRWAFVAPAAVLVFVFMASVPVSIFSNRTIYNNGICTVYHPPISAYMPAAIDFVLVVYLIVLFVEPLFRSALMLRPFSSRPTSSSGSESDDLESAKGRKLGLPFIFGRQKLRLGFLRGSRSNETLNSSDESRKLWRSRRKRVLSGLSSSFNYPTGEIRRQRRRLAVTLLATNLVSLTATTFFNATLSTPIGDWAPMVSSMDLAINYVFSVLPYFILKQGGDGDVVAGAASRAMVEEKQAGATGDREARRRVRISSAPAQSEIPVASRRNSSSSSLSKRDHQRRRPINQHLIPESLGSHGTGSYEGDAKDVSSASSVSGSSPTLRVDAVDVVLGNKFDHHSDVSEEANKITIAADGDGTASLNLEDGEWMKAI